MADSWTVTFFLDWDMTDEQMELVSKEIPRSLAVPGDNGTCITVIQGAPSSMEASNRVGSRLRVVLDRGTLGVRTLKIRPA